jgi:hypothetical protein
VLRYGGFPRGRTMLDRAVVVRPRSFGNRSGPGICAWVFTGVAGDVMSARPAVLAQRTPGHRAMDTDIRPRSGMRRARSTDRPVLGHGNAPATESSAESERRRLSHWRSSSAHERIVLSGPEPPNAPESGSAGSSAQPGTSEGAQRSLMELLGRHIFGGGVLSDEARRRRCPTHSARIPLPECGQAVSTCA